MKNYVAWIACLLVPATLALSGCSKAGKCVRGVIGCACKKDTESCDKGAMCDDKGMCVESSTTMNGNAGSSSSAGRSGNAGRSGGGGTGGSGKDGGTTRRDAGSGVDAGPVDCGSTFESACRGFCNTFCQEQQDLCLTSSCDPSSCAPGGKLYSQCAQVCNTDAACVKKICMAEIAAKRTCEDFGFLDDNMKVFLSACLMDDPKCVANPDYGCSDTCGSMSNNTGGDLASNNACEDGGKGSTQNLCPRGTDCTDCGPRTCSNNLGPCDNNGDCCGFYSKKALCVKPDPGTPSLCLANCTETGICPANQTCTMVKENNSKVCAP
jgi:hypothetical protein